MTTNAEVICQGELSLTSPVVVLVLLVLVQFAWIGHLHVPFLFQACESLQNHMVVAVMSILLPGIRVVHLPQLTKAL